MGLREQIIFVIVAVIVLYLFFRFLLKLLSQRRTWLPEETRGYADKIFNKLTYQFRQRHKREPSRNELFRRAINTSHIVERRRGWKGHWRRQRIRKYLLEKNKVIRQYKMR